MAPFRDFDFVEHTQVHFGSGRVTELGAIVASYGKRCMIVCGANINARTGLIDEISANLQQAGADVVVFDGARPNPTNLQADEGAKIAKAEEVDVILGVGGGSSMDLAKAIAVGATHEGSAWDYRLYSEQLITDATLPIVTLNTTAGTGSQVGPVAVITNEQANSKFALVDVRLCPRACVIDPELTRSVPKGTTARTGFDVFTHSFESMLHPKRSPMTDMFAIEAIRNVVTYLPRALDNGSDGEARAALAWADLLAGLCIANAGTVLPHGIAMAIGGHATHVPHGEALAVMYPEFTRYTCKAAIPQFATLARILDSTLADTADAEAAEASCDLLDDFLRRIGLYTDLQQIGVNREQLDSIADHSVRLPDYEMNPRIPDRDEILGMLNRAFTRRTAASS